MKITGVILIALLAFAGQGLGAMTLTYTVGDVDGIHYDGSGSVDDVYVDQDVLNSLGELYPEVPINPFDVATYDDFKPFTFVFPAPPAELVLGAQLEVGMRMLRWDITTDRLYFWNADATVMWGPYRFEDLGWLPLSEDVVEPRTVDLGNVLGDNVLHLLAAGQLNVMVEDDFTADYATLTLQVIPEPAALSLLALGGLMLMRRHRK